MHEYRDRYGRLCGHRQLPEPAVMRQWREDEQLTQRELADRLGVAPSTISAWERGAATPLHSLARRWLNWFRPRLKALDDAD